MLHTLNQPVLDKRMGGKLSLNALVLVIVASKNGYLAFAMFTYEQLLE